MLIKHDLFSYPVDEDGLNKLDNLQCNLQTDWDQVVVQNDESQEVVTKVTRLHVCENEAELMQFQDSP